MLKLEEALAILFSEPTAVTGVETVALDEGSGRVLAEDLFSSIKVPSSDNSAMDGYAFRFSDVSEKGLDIVQRIPAGEIGSRLGNGEAARIFTGASLPDGADTVVRQEWCSVENGKLNFLRSPKLGDSVRLAGSDINLGDLVLKAGTYLQAHHLGLAASIGRKTLVVHKRPKVALLVTGSELVTQGQALPPGKIYNSNQVVLKTLLQSFGCDVTEYGVVPDDFQITKNKLMEAAAEHDFILTSGGVSVGEEDHIKPVIQEEGTIFFWRVSVKPGKPVVYGEITSGKQHPIPIIGLPGNPVSVFVTFLLFVRPYLLQMQGRKAEMPRGIRVKSADDYETADERREFLRAKLDDKGDAVLFHNQNSGILSSLSWGDGLIDNPSGNRIQKGDVVSFIPFSSFFYV